MENDYNKMQDVVTDQSNPETITSQHEAVQQQTRGILLLHAQGSDVLHWTWGTTEQAHFHSGYHSETLIQASLWYITQQSEPST